MGMPIDQKIVIVTRPTRLQGLLARHATASQAKFLMVRAKLAAPRSRKQADPVEMAKEDQDLAAEASGLFEEIRDEDDDYQGIISSLREQFEDFAPVQVLDRQYLPNYVFGPQDVVVTLGQDGLVANTAKYALNLPIVAVNPDPRRIDGILLPFTPQEAPAMVRRALRGQVHIRRVTLAEATLNNGQRLLAFNDLFIGARTHVSARYRIEFEGRSEQQSSSGVIVSTGAGATGWLSSIFNMALGIGRLAGQVPSRVAAPRMTWEDGQLIFVTREPFLSKTSGVALTSGIVQAGRELMVESTMAREGVIFSDGIEADFLEFNTGAIARIAPASEHARLVVKR